MNDNNKFITFAYIYLWVNIFCILIYCISVKQIDIFAIVWFGNILVSFAAFKGIGNNRIRIEKLEKLIEYQKDEIISLKGNVQSEDTDNNNFTN